MSKAAKQRRIDSFFRASCHVSLYSGLDTVLSRGWSCERGLAGILSEKKKS